MSCLLLYRWSSCNGLFSFTKTSCTRMVPATLASCFLLVNWTRLRFRHSLILMLIVVCLFEPFLLGLPSHSFSLYCYTQYTDVSYLLSSLDSTLIHLSHSVKAGETFLSLFIVYDGLAVSSIIYFVSQQAKGFHLVPILELMQRDGLLCFAVMFSSNFVWLMMALHARVSAIPFGFCDRNNNEVFYDLAFIRIHSESVSF